MYELGIAHATREATEVVIFRDDIDPLPFDVTNLRVNRYDVNPDSNPEEARSSLQLALADALKELDLSKSMAVQIAMRKLDQTSYNLLIGALVTGSVAHPEGRSMRQALASVDALRALSLLLELGLLQPEYPDIYELAKQIGTPAGDQPASLPVTYKLTEIGKAVIMGIQLQHGGARLIEDSDLREQLDRYFSETQT